MEGALPRRPNVAHHTFLAPPGSLSPLSIVTLPEHETWDGRESFEAMVGRLVGVRTQRVVRTELIERTLEPVDFIVEQAREVADPELATGVNRETIVAQWAKARDRLRFAATPAGMAEQAIYAMLDPRGPVVPHDAPASRMVWRSPQLVRPASPVEEFGREVARRREVLGLSELQTEVWSAAARVLTQDPSRWRREALQALSPYEVPYGNSPRTESLTFGALISAAQIAAIVIVGNAWWGAAKAVESGDFLLATKCAVGGPGVAIALVGSVWLLVKVLERLHMD